MPPQDAAVPVALLRELLDAWGLGRQSNGRRLVDVVNDLLDYIPRQAVEEVGVERPMPRVMCVVEGGVVQGAYASEPVDFTVIDHDNFEDCANARGLPDTWTHEANCSDHTPEEWAEYKKACQDYDNLPVSVS